MNTIKVVLTIFTIALFSACSTSEWQSLFNGEDLTGWTASENPDSWKIEEGVLIADGPVSHLFYSGDIENHNFKNFELKMEVKTIPGANSGIYFHTEFQEGGWPEKGYECQVINSNRPGKPGEYKERKMTGSIYAIRNVWKSPAKDNEWFKYHIIVQGKTIRSYINDVLIAEFTEPVPPLPGPDMKGRILSSGTFALQCHDPESKVQFRNIQVKVLDDDLETPGTPPEDPDFEQMLINEFHSANFPLIDLHTHLKGDLTIEKAMQHAARYGFTYGIAVNCGIKMGFETDEEVLNFLEDYQKPPHSWLAMQAEGREWLDMFSEDVIAKFDYVFTDAMTWTNDNGKRMRLWIEEETEVGDPQDFMNQLVNRIEGILNNEPIDIYVNPTYLPKELDEQYDELWTEERMDRVIRALAENQIALEINNRLKKPSAVFIKKAKEAGVKFTFGTNNVDSDGLGRMEYAIEMVRECKITPEDLWIPEG